MREIFRSRRRRATVIKVAVALPFALLVVAGGTKLAAQPSVGQVTAAVERSATPDNAAIKMTGIVSGDLAETSFNGPSEASEEVTCLWIKAFEECTVQDGGIRNCKLAEPTYPGREHRDVGSADGQCLRKRVAANCRGLGSAGYERGQSTPSSVAQCGAGIFKEGSSLGGFLGSLKAGIHTAKFPAQVSFDRECVSVLPKTPAKICGFTGASWCPISLLWDQEALTQKNMSVVKFPLDPNREGSYSLWRGSEHAPLLVFDPEHLGKITSGRQLLGSFSFGGRRRSRSQDMGSDAAHYEPWENGFVALERLDIDQDGKISGAELAPLSLWFDRLRDGVSGPGEVLPITTQGVTALYYREPVSARGGRELRLEGGYDRLVNGLIEKGVAVDWVAETFSSETEAVKALGPVMRGGVEYFNTGPASPKSDWRKRPFDFFTRSGVNNPVDVSGFWIWGLVGASAVDSPGIFVLRRETNSSLSGFSLVESPVGPNQFGVQSVLSFLPVEGKVDQSEQGIRLAFITSDPESGMIATSTAVLIGEGGVLKGTTTQSFMGQGAERSASITYDWIAQKLVGAAGG